MREKNFLQIRECQAGVEDIFDKNHVAVFHGLIDVLSKADFAGRVPSACEFLRRAGTVAIAGDTDKVEGAIETNVAREIAEKNRSAFEHADEDDGLPGEITRDVGAHGGDALRNLFVRNQDLKLVHGEPY